jgi:hypothetical protein
MGLLYYMNELEDSKFFPLVLRKCQLQYIGHTVVWLAFYKDVAKKIAEKFSAGVYTTWVDLCTGSTLPSSYIHKSLKPIPVQYTDKFPLYANVMELDVLDATFTNQTFYTMFNSFHHFNTIQQQHIIQKMAQAKASFIIAEVLTPNIQSVIKVLLASTIGMWLTTPFIKPLSIWQIIFTYVIPINVITVCIDGVISVCKALTLQQMQQLATQYSVHGYTITATVQQNSKFGKTFILQGYASI